MATATITEPRLSWVRRGILRHRYELVADAPLVWKRRGLVRPRYVLVAVKAA